MASVVNGQMSSGLLVSVGGGQALRADAAAAWLAVVAEVSARYGVTLRLTDSYRPYAVQVKIFNERYDPASSGGGPFGDVRWWGGVRYVRMRGASAAVPGTSNHGWGVAVDAVVPGGFAGSTYAHLAAVAPAHGWSNASGRKIGEAWHWEYTPAEDGHPTPAPAQEDDMPLNEAEYARLKGDMQATADSAVRGLIPSIALAVAAITVQRVPGQPSTWLQDTVDGTTAALATHKVIAGLPAAIIAALPVSNGNGGTAAISTADLARIATAVADEQARRQAS